MLVHGRRRKVILVVSTAVFGFFATTAVAETRRKEPSSSNPCSPSATRALSELAAEVARKIPESLHPQLVGTAGLAAPRAGNPEVAACFARLVAEKIGTGVTASPSDIESPELRAKARTKSSVEVALSAERGVLRARAVVRPPVGSFWDRVKGGAPAPEATFLAERPADPAFITELTEVPLLSREFRAPLPTSDVVALGCGDPDGRGNVLVVVGRTRLLVGRLTEERFVVIAQKAWADLSPVAPSPLREPIAAVDVRAGEGFRIGTTDRQKGLLLSPTLAVKGELERPIPWRTIGCLSRAGTAIGAPERCTPGEGSTARPPEGLLVDGIGSAEWTDSAGAKRSLAVYRDAQNRGVTLFDEAGKKLDVGVAGAAMAAGDLDADGTAELLTTEDDLAPARDALTIRSVDKTGLRMRSRKAVPEGIRAIAVCPAEREAKPRVVLVTTERLWVLE